MEISEQRFFMVKCEGKADHPPEYMRDVTLAEIFAYYFNWHPHLTNATHEDIAIWFREARGWCWEPLN